MARPGSRAALGMGLRQLVCWDCGLFESRRGHVCLSDVSVVCCQVEISVTGWSLVQRSPTDCGASLCMIYKPQEWGGPDPRWVAAPQKKIFLKTVMLIFYARSQFFPYFHNKNNKQPYYNQTAVHSARANNLRPDRTVKGLQIPLSLRFRRLHHVRVSCLASIAWVPIRWRDSLRSTFRTSPRFQSVYWCLSFLRQSSIFICLNLAALDNTAS